MLICFKKSVVCFSSISSVVVLGSGQIFLGKSCVGRMKNVGYMEWKKKKKKDVGRRLACSGAVVPVPSQECRPFCRFCCCKMVQPDRRHNTATPRMMLSHWVCVCVSHAYKHTHSFIRHAWARSCSRQQPPAFHFPLSSKVMDTAIFCLCHCLA